jgi:hypothetical protein
MQVEIPAKYSLCTSGERFSWAWCLVFMPGNKAWAQGKLAARAAGHGNRAVNIPFFCRGGAYNAFLGVARAVNPLSFIKHRIAS